MDSWHNFSDHSGDKSSTTFTVEKHHSHLATSKDNQPETSEESTIEITNMNTDNGVTDVTHSIQKNSKILSDAELSNRSETDRSTAASYKDRNNHSNIFGAPMAPPTYGRKHASNDSTPPPTATSPEYYDAKHHLEYHGVQHHDEKEHTETHYQEKKEKSSEYDGRHHDEKHYEEKRSPRKDGNPISGEGYGGDTVTNEIGAYRQHSNVPPGGFCSNIWYE